MDERNAHRLAEQKTGVRMDYGIVGRREKMMGVLHVVEHDLEMANVVGDCDLIVGGVH